MYKSNGDLGEVAESETGTQEGHVSQYGPYMGPAQKQLRKLRGSGDGTSTPRDPNSLGPAQDLLRRIRQEQEADLYSTAEILYNQNKLLGSGGFEELRKMARLSEPNYNMKATEVPMPKLDFAVDKLVMAYGGKAAGYKN